jgi:hypothetical protein
VTDLRCDLFVSEEDDSWWVRRQDGLSRWAAAQEVAALCGDYPTSAYVVRAVKGRVGEQCGEPWFWRDPEGTESFYEVTLR